MEEKVRKKLLDLVDFIKPHEDLLHSHIVEIFTHDLWNKHVPLEIQNELLSTKSLNEFLMLYPNIMCDECPKEFSENHQNLVNFLKNANSISIRKDESFLLQMEDLYERLLSLGCKNYGGIRLQGFMKKKKLHEVVVMSQVSALMADLTGSPYFVDIGGGKGYLSSALTLHYNHKVLGIDSCQVTTCGAIKRAQKLARLWKGLGETKEQPEKDNNNEKKLYGKAVYEELVKTHYKPLIQYVTAETDLRKLVTDQFEDTCETINLVGLHTCGDLSPTCLKIFANNQQVKSLVNVGCCYHLLNEEQVDGSFWDGDEAGTTEEFGFPMSDCLKNRKFFFGRNVRMIAEHPLDKLVHQYNKFSQESVFFRSILQTITEKHLATKLEVHIGKLYSKSKDFHDYMRKAFKMLDLDIEMTDEELTCLYNKYRPKEPLLKAFYLLRLSLAPVVETIILLDKHLFLLEQGFKDAYLVPIFDPVVSPRGYATVAWKDKS